jgi:hypothetical protein
MLNLPTSAFTSPCSAMLGSVLALSAVTESIGGKTDVRLSGGWLYLKRTNGEVIALTPK